MSALHWVSVTDLIEAVRRAAFSIVRGVVCAHAFSFMRVFKARSRAKGAAVTTAAGKSVSLWHVAASIVRTPAMLQYLQGRGVRPFTPIFSTPRTPGSGRSTGAASTQSRRSRTGSTLASRSRPRLRPGSSPSASPSQAAWLSPNRRGRPPSVTQPGSPQLDHSKRGGTGSDAGATSGGGGGGGGAGAGAGAGAGVGAGADAGVGAGASSRAGDRSDMRGRGCHVRTGDTGTPRQPSRRQLLLREGSHMAPRISSKDVQQPTSVAQCAWASCTRPAATRKNGAFHLYCSLDHRRKALAAAAQQPTAPLRIPSTHKGARATPPKTGTRPGAVAASATGTAGAVTTCKLPSCTRPVRRRKDGTLHLYCSARHHRAAHTHRRQDRERVTRPSQGAPEK